MTKSLNGSSFLCLNNIKVMKAILWAILLMKWLMNFLPNFLKVLIDFGLSDENQDLVAFLSVVGKALHIITSLALLIDILFRNISRSSIGPIVLSYDSMVERLNHCGGVASSNSCVKGEVPNNSILASMSSHFLSMLASSRSLISLSLRLLASSLPYSF